MDPAVTIEEYKRRLHAEGYAANTIKLYRWGLDEFKQYLHGLDIDDLRQVSKSMILDYQAKVVGATNATETRAIKIRPVKRLFEYLNKTNRLLINPAEGIIETHRIKRRMGIVLTVAEMEALLQQPNLSFSMQLRDRAMMEVLYATALRLNELLHLTVYDADFCDGVVFVRKGKGRRQRVVPLSKTAAD